LFKVSLLTYNAELLAPPTSQSVCQFYVRNNKNPLNEASKPLANSPSLTQSLTPPGCKRTLEPQWDGIAYVIDLQRLQEKNGCEVFS